MKNKLRNFIWIVTGIILMSVFVYASTIISDISVTTENISLSDRILVRDGTTRDHDYEFGINSRISYSDNSTSTPHRNIVSELVYNGTENSATYYNSHHSSIDLRSNVNLTTGGEDAGLIAYQGNVHHKGNGTLSRGQVFRSRCNNEEEGTITDCINYMAVGGKNIGDGTYTTEYGFYMDDTSNASTTRPLWLLDNGTSFINGSLGIGKYNPGTKVVIDNTIDSSTSELLSLNFNYASTDITASGGPLIFSNTNGNDKSWIRITFSDADSSASAIMGVQLVDTSSNYGDIAFYTRSASGLDQQMRIGEHNVTLGPGDRQVNITLTSPNGTEYTCGVANGGTFSCS